MNIARLIFWRRPVERAGDADPFVTAVRWREILRTDVVLLSVIAAAGVLAAAKDPIPAGVPLSAIYLVVNGGFAFRTTRDDLERIRMAVDFRPGVIVRLGESDPVWGRVFGPAVVFVVFDLFWGLAAAGRLTLAYVLPFLAQAVITRRAVRRRERAGDDIYVWDGRVSAHPRVDPLPCAA